ncbi:hypothetical protein BD324DRAFT_430480 [Kockovaella imperatae]|uniref:E3 ubiquitin-protein ligase PEP5 n=1 Tax=Kockovaella imperatae TaxID=4999 RepID=A0A1Y1UGU2_9TREE|nr:hypothetical protein BD324DRAFT_430480 [Kockovaella imperatae]ORX37189.1 hypothetical protein BD324DRAFT_430480 [Kockovaella imperatae]
MDQSEGSSSSWRQFSFFDAEPFASGDEGSPEFEQLRSPLIIEPVSYSSTLSVAVASGDTVHFFNNHLRSYRSFQAWKDNGHTSLLRQAANVLICVGEEGDSRLPILKAWDLSRDTRRGPVLLRSVRVGQRSALVTCLACTPNLSHLALGFSDGTVLLYRHFLQSLTTSPTSLSSMPKARIVHESPEPVTGLGFVESDVDGPTLMIATVGAILSSGTTGKSGRARVLDRSGVALGCAVISHDRRELLVARNEGIYSFGTSDPGPFYAYDGEKASLQVHNHNLVFVLREESKSRARDTTPSSKLVILDHRHRWTSYQKHFSSGIDRMFSQWGALYVQAVDQPLMRLIEHSISAKLQVLSQRNLYTTALALAKSEGFNEAGLSDIHRLYGDYLYRKGDYDAAMRQYTLTLGQLPPSYVVRKYLDAQRIQQLVAYLQRLHELGLANPNHTTLLLNCYTKTGDLASLDAFLNSEMTDDELPFDLDTAIRVCRQGAFFAHASFLAQRWGRHEEYLRIQIEDAGEFLAALRYLRGLDREVCTENLLLYGVPLLAHAPIETTDLVIDLCCGLPLIPQQQAVSANGSGPATGQAVLSFLNVDRVTGLFVDNSHIDTAPDDMPLQAADVPIELPSPRRFFPLFNDNVDQFRRFLETVTNLDKEGNSSSNNDADASRSIWSTLLELYLTAGGADGRAKAMTLLREKSDKLDPVLALILCTQTGFTPGCLVLWESLGRHEDVLRFWMESDSDPDAYSHIAKYLETHGQDHHELYAMALRHLSSTPKLLALHGEDVSRILQIMDENNILQPLAIVQLLSRNSITPIGTVRDWLQAKVQENRGGIESDKHLVSSYRKETEQRQNELQNICDPDRPQVFQVTRCAACARQLDLPTVHFMCKHSYHQRCLSDSEPECILCARQHSILREVRQGQKKLADRHDLFVNEVHDADNGFAVVAGAFGRGLWESAAA